MDLMTEEMMYSKSDKSENREHEEKNVQDKTQNVYRSRGRIQIYGGSIGSISVAN